MGNIKVEVVLEIPFLKLSNANMLFGEKIFMWKIYTTNKALFNTQRVQIINKKNFVIAVMNVDNGIFIVYMAIKKQKKMIIHFN